MLEVCVPIWLFVKSKIWFQTIPLDISVYYKGQGCFFKEPFFKPFLMCLVQHCIHISFSQIS